MTAAVSLDALRARIREIEGSARVERRRHSSGVELVDRLIGGLPCPGLVEVSGPPGTGRTRLALQLVAAATAGGRAVAWIDPDRRLYPPALAALGIPLDRLLLVHPPAVAAPGEGGPVVWATEQILRSGCFPLVVASLPEQRQGFDRSGGHTWARAAERGHCVALVLGTHPRRTLPADVRLATSRSGVQVLRDRGGRPGASAPLPWPPPLDPWS